MPFTKDTLDSIGIRRLRPILFKMIAHKSALAQKPNNKKSHVELRNKAIAKQKRKNLMFNNEAYENLSPAEKKAYLIDKILIVQNEPFLAGSKYANDYKDKLPDYTKDFKNKKIDEKSGYIIQQEDEEEPEPEKVLVSEIQKYKPEEEKQAEPEPEEPEPEPEPVETQPVETQPVETQQEMKEEPNKEVSLMTGLRKFRGRRYEAYLDALYDFDNRISEFKNLKSGDSGLLSEINDHVMESLERLSESAFRKDKTQNDMRIQKVKEYGDELKKAIGIVGISTADTSRIKQRLEQYKQNERRPEAMKPAMQYVEDVEKVQNTPETSFESKEKNVFIDQSNKGKTVGDSNIGNVRAIGLSPMTAPAREEEVIPPPSERAKSLRRFANFRWVYSNQNSDLGYDSPFQRIQDQEDKRRFGMCYLPTSKLPKPETQEDLNKVKSFNTYPLVPSQNLSGIMQPAGELSFKSSTNPNARKITIDEKQFANTKLYNFEPTQVNIKSNNPFSGMYGMQPLDQIKRNPDIQANTLEFSSVMYDDCPFERIKNKYNKKIIT